MCAWCRGAEALVAMGTLDSMGRSPDTLTRKPYARLIYPIECHYKSSSRWRLSPRSGCS